MYWLFTYIFLAIYRCRCLIYTYIYTLYMLAYLLDILYSTYEAYFLSGIETCWRFTVLVLMFFYGAYSGLGSSV